MSAYIFDEEYVSLHNGAIVWPRKSVYQSHCLTENVPACQGHCLTESVSACVLELLFWLRTYQCVFQSHCLCQCIIAIAKAYA